eukprot:superscaffoldBa00007079_g22202
MLGLAFTVAELVTSWSLALFSQKKLTSNSRGPALVDSGADDNFLDSNLVAQADIAVEQLPTPLEVNALDGRLLTHITHRTKLHLLLSGNHHEMIQFHIIPSSQTPIILQLWLKRHNPHIDWSTGKVVSWSSFCHSSCLKSALAPVKAAVPRPVTETPELSSIPSVYHDLREVFSKQRALSLPPRHPYDCAIDPLPGAPLPSGRLYNVSRPERETMEKYIHYSLAAELLQTCATVHTPHCTLLLSEATKSGSVSHYIF